MTWQVHSAADYETIDPNDADEADQYHAPEWGPWVLHRSTRSLAHQSGRYVIDLERRCTSAGVLDIICQISLKGWADPECVAGLVHALNDILRPQRGMCSFGHDKAFTLARIHQMIDRPNISPRAVFSPEMERARLAKNES